MGEDEDGWTRMSTGCRFPFVRVHLPPSTLTLGLSVSRLDR
jgi:hypothetical protein